MVETVGLPSREGVLAAAGRVEGQVTRTPLLPFEYDGRRFWAKAECLQQGGAFKLRGATNRLLRIAADQRSKGVVAFSSGNHARGVAIAARRLGMAATIVMPADAPAVKREATAAEGATIILYDRAGGEDRIAIAARLAAETGAPVVAAFDDTDVIEGQGTIGLEIVDQLGAPPTLIAMPCGGGGLAAGIGLAVPEARIVPVEPVGWDVVGRSIAAGSAASIGPGAPVTICDSLQPMTGSDLTADVLRSRQATPVTVTDDEVKAAMRFAFSALRLVVEPGGAAALAALLARRFEAPDGSVVVLSGGNVDPALYASMLNGSDAG